MDDKGTSYITENDIYNKFVSIDVSSKDISYSEEEC